MKSSKSLRKGDTSVINLRKKIKNYKAIDHELTMSVYDLISNSRPLGVNDKFWVYINRVLAEVEYYIKRRSSLSNPNMVVVCESVKTAVEEIARQDRLSNNFDNFIGFAHSYGLLDSYIDGVFEETESLELGMSDDTYSDFCDALPLAGKEVIDKILSKSYTKATKLKADIRKNNPKWLAKMDLEGELYMHMALADAIKVHLT